MTLDYQGLISKPFREHLKLVLNPNSEELTYYIDNSIDLISLNKYYQESDTYHIKYRDINLSSIGHSDSDRKFIRDLFLKLDPIIDLDFREMNTDNGSQVDIYSVDKRISWENNVVGEMIMQTSKSGSWIEILWKDTDGKNKTNSGDKNTIIHEFGHTLGLSHPYESPYSPNWTNDDTAMSVNIGENGWSSWFTDTDILALKNMWGSENDNGNIYFNYPSSSYKFIKESDSEYKIETEYGTEVITNLNNLIFTDSTKSVEKDIKNVFNKIIGKDHITGKIFRLYQASFNRFPDYDGFQYWINKNISNENTYQQTATSFIISKEFKESYGEDLTSEKFITQLYSNILNRIPDIDGYSYWLNNLNNEVETRTEVLMGFSESQENKTLFQESTNIY